MPNSSSTTLLKVSCAALLGASLAPSSSAALLFHEPFDYAAGTGIAGQTPALGAASGWVDTSSGNGTPGGTPTAMPLTVRVVGTNGGATSGQGWTGIPASSAFANSGGYMEGMRRDNNEGHIVLATSVTDQFVDGASIWLSYVSAPTTNSGGNNNHEPDLAIGAAPIGGGTLDRARVAQGEAVGVGSDFSSTNSPVQAAYWEAGTFNQNLSGSAYAGTNPLTFEQQLIIARIDFGATGETITVNRFELDGSFTNPTEADFNSGAVSITSATDLDNSSFNTLSFDAVRANLDEIRIATTFDEVIGIPEPSTALLGLFCLLYTSPSPRD